MSALGTAKAKFRSRSRMFRDCLGTVKDAQSSVAAGVAYRCVSKYQQEFLEAYEIILQHEKDIEEEEFTRFTGEFSEVNNIILELEQSVSGMSKIEKDVKVRGTHESGEVSAKLPFIEIPKFSGNFMEWMSFSDLFISLVHDRKGISDSEKHYYLRASLQGEALSIIKHLPMDGPNYQVAFNLLKERFDNVRLLTDSYLKRIFSLPSVTVTSDIRREFYDPLRESVQALDKLKLPVGEWSYLLVFIILQKLPPRIRTVFEERYGKDPNSLPTFTHLLEVVEEQGRLQLTVMDQGNRGAVPKSTPDRQLRKASEDQRRTYNRISTISHQDHQVNRSQCSYCRSTDHTLYRCSRFLDLPFKKRKEWAWETEACFICLRDHLSKDCTQRNWCKDCGSRDHNSLLCPELGSGKTKDPDHERRKVSSQPVKDQGHGSQRPGQGRRWETPRSSGNGRRSPRSDDGTREAGPPRQESVRSTVTYQNQEESSFDQVTPRPQPGSRVQQANQRFMELRFGRQSSSPTE